MTAKSQGNESLFALRCYGFVYERILPRLPRRFPRVETWLLRRGSEIQRRLAE